MASFNGLHDPRRKPRTAPAKPPAAASDARRRMIGAVRAACQRQGIGDDDRRAIQQEVTGKASMTDMDAGDLGRLLDRLNHGWKGPAGHRAHIGKVRALWWTLHWLGAVADPAERTLDAFVKRQTGVDALRFLDHRQAHAVIEALKAWATREGVAWPAKPDPFDDRRAVAGAIWHRLVQVAPIGNVSLDAFLAAALAVPGGQAEWSARTWDEAIRLLGKRLRQGTGKA